MTDGVNIRWQYPGTPMDRPIEIQLLQVDGTVEETFIFTLGEVLRNREKVDEINAKWEQWNMRIETIKTLQAKVEQLTKLKECLKKLCQTYTGKERDSSYEIFYNMVQKILGEKA